MSTDLSREFLLEEMGFMSEGAWGREWGRGEGIDFKNM
jgi:hypothetical protein